MNGSGLYIMSGQTNSLRSFATASIFFQLSQLWRPYGYRVDLTRRGRVISILVVIPRAWLLLLGLYHWWVALRTRRIAAVTARELKIDVVSFVRVR